MKPVLLFDIGDTLAVRVPDEYSLYVARLAAVGVELAPERRADLLRALHMAAGRQIEREQAGAPFLDDAGFQRLMDAAALSAARAQGDPCADALNHLAALPMPETRRELLPGVIEMLDSLKAEGYRMGVVSNERADLLVFMMEVGLSRFFDTVIISDVVGVSKPDPEILRLACRALSVEPGECLYIGDHPLDIVCAARAGMPVAWVRGEGDDLPADVAERPDHVLADVLSLPALLRGETDAPKPRAENPIEAYYDERDEWARFNRNIVEFAVTKRYMDARIPAEPQRVLDIGGGPGRYSIYLAEKGHAVTLLDLSSVSIERAKQHAKDAGVQLAGYIHGDALNLPKFDQQFDVVLLMGPLYHLLSEDDRTRSVRQAMSVLKPGGLLFASFISSYAPLHDYFAKEIPINMHDAESLLKYLGRGENADRGGFTVAYFIDPDEARAFMARFDLEPLAFAGVENMLAARERELLGQPREVIDAWLEVAWRLSEDENLVGVSHHFLYIGRKLGA